jgi:hypothetical protein
MEKKSTFGDYSQRVVEYMLKHNLLQPRLQYLNGSKWQISLKISNRLVNRFVQVQRCESQMHNMV